MTSFYTDSYAREGTNLGATFLTESHTKELMLQLADFNIRS